MELFDEGFININMAYSHHNPELLPIHRFKEKILWAINSHNVVILVGETGSGKSTQLPQLLYSSGWCKNGKSIVISLPRRISTINLSTSVAQEMNTELGHKVGYSIRYESKVLPGVTSIKFVTDGMLIREIMRDPLLLSYSVVILDDAHERSLNTDILLALLKRMIKKRQSLRLVLTSATLDCENFESFFKRNDYEYLITHKMIEPIPTRWDKSTFNNFTQTPGDKSDTQNMQESLPNHRETEIISANYPHEVIDLSLGKSVSTEYNSGDKLTSSTLCADKKQMTDDDYPIPSKTFKGTDVMNMRGDHDLKESSRSPSGIPKVSKSHRGIKKHHKTSPGREEKKHRHRQSPDRYAYTRKESKEYKKKRKPSHKHHHQPRDSLEVIPSVTKHLHREYYHGLEPRDNNAKVSYGPLKDVCIVSISGNSFPIDTYYLLEPQQDYLECIVNTVLDIHQRELSGDILIFLTGQEEIEAIIQAIKDLAYETSKEGSLILKPIPLYSALPQESILSVFKPSPKSVRRVICSTNIAEASITIENIGYVIDSGFTKCKVYDPSTNIEYLNVCVASKSNARQRAGRAGRTRPGKVYRMMEEHIYMSDIVPKFSVPDILTSDLSTLILQLKSLGIDHISDIEFISPPSLESIEAALEKLFALEGLDEQGQLTQPLGHLMAEIPLDPMTTRMIYLSSKDPYNCSDIALKIASMLSIRDLWFVSKNKFRLEASKYFFGVSEGDLLTLYHIYEQAVNYGQDDSEWAQKYCFKWSSLNKAFLLYKRLKSQLNQFNIKIVTSTVEPTTLCKLFCASFFLNAIKRQKDGTYIKCQQKEQLNQIALSIHPNSVMQALSPSWLIYTEATGMADKTYARNLSYIQPQWLVELCPHYFQMG